MRQREIPWSDPLDVFEAAADDPFAILLHGEAYGGWSLIGAAPSHVICGEAAQGEPFAEIASLAKARRTRGRPECGAPLTCGIAGFAGYEALRWREPSVAAPPSPFSAPDFQFGVFDAIAAFDRAKRRAYVISRSRDAEEALMNALSRGPDARPQGARPGIEPPDRDRYLRHVRETRARIAAGDLFQANIAHTIQAEIAGATSAYGLFRHGARAMRPPHGAYIRSGNLEILSFSPERFFRVDAERRIIAEPIKGTRPRGEDEKSDRALLEALLSDEKDRAENIMIADLTRNDLAQVCEDHSIKEEAICEAFTTDKVHHLVSRISGRLRDDCDATDALFAMFPCGSITGAPKVEAMRLIAELERVGRGPYCGAIGFVDDSGIADFSVAIRTAIAEPIDGGLRLSYGVGAGVTLQSDPDAEFKETIDKARAFFALLEP